MKMPKKKENQPEVDSSRFYDQWQKEQDQFDRDAAELESQPGNEIFGTTVKKLGDRIRKFLEEDEKNQDK